MDLSLPVINVGRASVSSASLKTHSCLIIKLGTLDRRCLCTGGELYLITALKHC